MFGVSVCSVEKLWSDIQTRHCWWTSDFWQNIGLTSVWIQNSCKVKCTCRFFNSLIKASVGAAIVPECFGWGSGGVAPNCYSQSCHPRRPELHAHRSLAGCWRSLSGLCSAPSGWLAHYSTPVHLHTHKYRNLMLKLDLLFIYSQDLVFALLWWWLFCFFLGTLASHFMLAMLPASLQFLPVIVELLQTHDSIL